MSFEFNGHEIKAITIKQPYASLIINGIQNVENRSWRKKIHKDACKNWLFVHASSKYASKKEIKKIDNIPDNFDYPSSCIIGMMHINCVGKVSDAVHKCSWAKGPNCWYIDAVIKFKTPIPTTGKLGQWDPDPSLHDQLTDQITDSMYSIIPLDNIEFVKKEDIYYAVQRGKYMTWESIIRSLIEKTDTFTYKLIQFLLSIDYNAYFWECDQVDMKKPFRFAIFNSKTLAERKQEDNAFKGVINCGNRLAIAFPSLSKDVHLVVPCYKSVADYTSLATFSRTAPIKQQVAFWKKVGQNIKEGDWVSTSGLGVAWLHVRIASRPKYYHDAFEKKKNGGRRKMEEYIENFNFPKDFVNIIIIGKNWKQKEQKDLITYYLELLPKDTKVVGMGKMLEDKVKEVHLKFDLYETDWKKDGRFAKQKTFDKMIEDRVDLITLFGKNDIKLTSDIHVLQVN